MALRARRNKRRLVRTADGREVLQMRVEMGVLQLETAGRPDGQRPGGAETYFDAPVELGRQGGDDFELNADQCAEADREFMQFYHRRVCWLALREFRRAAADADHTLGFMDFVRDHSPDEEWTASHEQYRPFVLFHRTQASTLATLEEIGPAKRPCRNCSAARLDSASCSITMTPRSTSSRMSWCSG